MAAFPEALRNLRLSRSLTQRELAQRSEVSVDAVRRLERGRYSPTLDTLSKLAKGLGVSLAGMFSQLVTGEVDERRELLDSVLRLPSSQLAIAVRVLDAFLDP